MASNTAECRRILESHLDVVEVDGRIIVVGAKSGSLTDALERAYRESVAAGCYIHARRSKYGVEVSLYQAGGGGQKLLAALVLFAATVVSVYVSGLAAAEPEYGSLWTPYSFLAGLLGPLILHELGHWIFMKRYGVPSSLPYFIPAPPLQVGFIGTFGAVINMRWLPSRPGKLALIGIAGPLAGFIAALPVAYLGIQASIVQPAAGTAPLQLVPLIMLLLPLPVEPGPGEVVVVSTAAFAAYIVFLVTFLNLLPVAMLDGGHVARSLLGFEGHRRLSLAFIVGFLLLSTLYPAFTGFALIMILLYTLTGGRHPGAAVEEWPPDWRAIISAILYALLLVLTLPIPA